MKILFVTLGSIGDLSPMLSLETECRRRGQEGLIVCSPSQVRVARDFGAKAVACPPQPRRPELPQAGEWGGLRGLAKHICDDILPTTDHAVDRLTPLVEAADLVVAHQLSFAAAIAARRMRKVCVALVWLPLSYGHFVPRMRQEWGVWWERFCSEVSTVAYPRLDQIALGYGVSAPKSWLAWWRTEGCAIVRCDPWQEGPRTDSMLLEEGCPAFSTGFPLMTEERRFTWGSELLVSFGANLPANRDVIGRVIEAATSIGWHVTIIGSGRRTLSDSIGNDNVSVQRLFPCIDQEGIVGVIAQGGIGNVTYVLGCGVPAIVGGAVNDQRYNVERLRTEVSPISCEKADVLRSMASPMLSGACVSVVGASYGRVQSSGEPSSEIVEFAVNIAR